MLKTPIAKKIKRKRIQYSLDYVPKWSGSRNFITVKEDSYMAYKLQTYNSTNYKLENQTSTTHTYISLTGIKGLIATTIATEG